MNILQIRSRRKNKKAMRIEQKLICEFAHKLDDIYYELLVTMIVGIEAYYAPFSSYSRVRRDTKNLDKHTRTILLFFYLGEVCDKNIIESFLGDELMHYLNEIDVLDYDESSCWLNNFLVIPYMKCYFVVSNSPIYPTCQDSTQKVYIGQDSYLIARNLANEVGKKVLNLWPGSGIHAILSAKTAEEVVTVDIDPVAIEIAKFNAFLNGVGDKICFRAGNLYEAVKNETFDYIIANPHFSLVPGEIELKTNEFGWGDGAMSLSELLEGCKRCLKVNGCAIVVGRALGNYEYIFLEDDVRRICLNMSAKLFAWDNVTISSLVGQTIKEAKEKIVNTSFSYEELEKIYISKGITEVYSFILFLFNKEGELSTTYMRNNWNREDIPTVLIRKVEKLGSIYGMYTVGNTMFMCSDEQKYFIENIDGKNSVEEILEKFPLQYRVNHSASEWSLLTSYLSFCGMLERMGIISKRKEK